MKFEIKKQTRNPLFNREEILLEITADNNPRNEDVLNFLKKDPETCVIQEIQGNFGRNVFEAGVYIYDSVKDKETTEYIPMKTRKKLEEEKKKKEEIEAKAREEAKKKEEVKNGN